MVKILCKDGVIVQMLLKCADIGHLAAAPANHKRWALCLEEEFFQQVTVHLAHGIHFAQHYMLADLQTVNYKCYLTSVDHGPRHVCEAIIMV